MCHLLQSQRDLAPLGGAREGPQIAEMAVWLSKGAVDSGLVVARAVGAAKARIMEACPAIVGRVAVRGLVKLLGCTVVQRYVLPRGALGELFLLAPLCSFSEPVRPQVPCSLPA